MSTSSSNDEHHADGDTRQDEQPPAVDRGGDGSSSSSPKPVLKAKVIGPTFSSVEVPPDYSKEVRDCVKTVLDAEPSEKDHQFRKIQSLVAESASTMREQLSVIGRHVTTSNHDSLIDEYQFETKVTEVLVNKP